MDKLTCKTCAQVKVGPDMMCIYEMERDDDDDKKLRLRSRFWQCYSCFGHGVQGCRFCGKSFKCSVITCASVAGGFCNERELEQHLSTE